MTDGLQGLLAEGVTAGVFPCARAVVRWRGLRVFEGGAGGVGAATVFDLASLTKVMATTPVFLALWADGRLEPETPVSRFAPESAAGRSDVTVGDLAYHRAGLPAFLPFFAAALATWPRLVQPDCPPELRAAARQGVVDRALRTPAVAPVAARAVYSDVGFIVLGELLARAGGLPLDRLFAERVAAPLGLAARFHRLSEAAPPGRGAVAPTGVARPREPAPGQEGLWAPSGARLSPPGEVDDDNAWVMDGVGGHAGLFGTAADVATVGQAVLDEVAGAGRIAPGACWERALARDGTTPGSTRALGFDTRLPGDGPGSSAGSWIGDTTPGAVGHLGFTGVSLWVDRARELVVALCTNRTLTGRANLRIGEFRPRFHDAVVRALGLASTSAPAGRS